MLLLVASADMPHVQPNNFEVLPNGLESVLEGLHRLRDGKVSAGKLVVHPQETP